MTTTHQVQWTPGGAECSCGRVFSVWTTAGSFAAGHSGKRNLARANARRHADAANAKETKA